MDLAESHELSITDAIISYLKLDVSSAQLQHMPRAERRLQKAFAKLPVSFVEATIGCEELGELC